jgi:hypothetical protein
MFLTGAWNELHVCLMWPAPLKCQATVQPGLGHALWAEANRASSSHLTRRTNGKTRTIRAAHVWMPVHETQENAGDQIILA